MPIGFTLPFARSSGSLGYFETTQDELSAVRENLKSLLITNWGERVMNYNFGCNLIEFLFENEGSEETREKIIDRIYNQVSTWLPFITVQEIEVLFPSDDSNIPSNSLRIAIKFKLTSRPNLSSTLDFLAHSGGE